ncbi:hypothetical protein HDU88_001247 [Geranomyces variabilis]|nr:hypothetical protein HDU88_001247 [Geranomyces variabilis]
MSQPIALHSVRSADAPHDEIWVPAPIDSPRAPPRASSSYSLGAQFQRTGTSGSSLVLPPHPNTPPHIYFRSLRTSHFWSVVLLGCSLAVVAGYINAVTLFGTFGISTSHTTGNTTQMAYSLVQGEVARALRFAYVLFAFLVGAAVSGAILGSSTFHPRRGYGSIMLLEAACLLLAYLLQINIVSQGAAFAALACGMQNSMVSNYSGAVIRTTHVTGTTTDIGNIIGQSIFHPAQRKHLWKLRVLVPLYVSFFIGSAIGSACLRVLHDRSLLVPAAVEAAFGVFHLMWWWHLKLAKVAAKSVKGPC